jgi:ABC-2 type transport system ATP-binding protein
MQAAIVTRNLVRKFGARAAVNGIDIEAPPGAVYAFLGPNGAGKTTTIRLLLGLLRPTSGDIEILGMKQPGDRIAIARRVGALVETPCLYDHLTGRDNLDLTRGLIGAELGEIDRALEIVDLARDAGRRVGGYSLGMRQRLGLARALLGRPSLLILDEPTNGLDPHGIMDMRRLIRALPERQGATVFVSSHLLAEVEHIATHVGLMHEGRLVRQGPLDALIGAEAKTYDLAVNDVARALRLAAEAGGRAIARADGMIEVSSVDGKPFDAAALNRRLVESGVDVAALTPRKPTLEDLFVALTAAQPPTTAAVPAAVDAAA